MAVTTQKKKAAGTNGVSYTAISGLAPASLDVDYEEFTPDAHVIATQIVYQGKRKNIPVLVNAHDLAAFITTIALDHTRSGASSLTITLSDPMWTILDSGFFAADPTGKLLDIDINYPDASRYWWRLHQFSPSGAGRSIQVTFLPRAVAKLMGFFGPVQVDRASRTRAEFLKSLCGKVPEVEFYSRELDQKQAIAKGGGSPGGLSVSALAAVANTSTANQSNANTSTVSSSKAKDGQAAKSKGVGANAQNLTIGGSRMTATQAKFANMILQQGDQMNAPQAALEACVFSGIAESTMGVNMGWDSGNARYGGLLAGDISNFGHFGAAGSDAVALAEITAYFQGGLGYGDGAIKLCKQYQNICQLAVHVAGAVLTDGSYGPNGYGQYGNENVPQITADAKAIVAGGGGSGGAASFDTSEKVAQPYYFQVKQGEDYWTAMCRLAQEVGWELIADGDRVYYDSDKVLITQKVAGVVDRDDPTTLDWSYDWENRHLATNFRLNLVADPFEFMAGEVLQVTNFGVATTGSTAKPPLPGRWMIDEVTHTKGDMFSVVSLVQPLPAQPEPAPQYTSVTVPGQSTAAPDGTGGAAAGGFANPFPDGWTPGRLDMGYDGTFKNQIVAPFDGLVTYATRSFSNWGGYIVLQSAKDIGLPTKTLYFAEGIFPTVAGNTWVKAGQKIAVPGTVGAQGGHPGLIEFGVAIEANGLGPMDPYGTQLGGGTAATDASRKMVLNFSTWCQGKLGIAAPASTGDAGHF